MRRGLRLVALGTLAGPYAGTAWMHMQIVVTLDPQPRGSTSELESSAGAEP
jgi:hypothetical protein